MMIRLLKSVINALPFNFEEAVNEHIAAKMAHRYAVEGTAAPTHHPLVDASVKRVQYPIEEDRIDEFVANYEIIDDTPPLWERKKALIAVVEKHEEELGDRIWPLALRRMEMIELDDLRAAEHQTKADKKRIEAIEAKMAKLATLQRKAAHVIGTIDVLDESNIGSWTFNLEA